ncbi:MAG: fibronectin type III domain-containing protein, partial [Gemmatimonadetes bacterium]
DDSFRPARFRIEEPADDMREWIEEHICLPYGLGYYLDEMGRVVPVDLRAPESTAGLPTITDTDVDPGEAPSWEHSHEGAVSLIEATYYVEHEVEEATLAETAGEYPDLPPSRVVEVDHRLVLADFAGVADGRDQAVKIDARGYRAFLHDAADDHSATVRAVEAALLGVMDDIRAVFGPGPMATTVACRRTPTVTAIRPGDLVVLDVTGLPDPASLTRTGPRVVRCVGVEEDRLLVRLSMVDLGPDSVAVTPTLGTPALVVGLERTAVSLPVTLNAAGEPVVVEYAVTSQAVAMQPSTGWAFGGRAEATGSVVIEGLPSGARVWLRARTRTGADTPKLPSAWVSPTPQFVDMASLAPPSGVTVADVTGSTARVSWTPGESEAETEVWLRQGADSLHVLTVEEGSDEVTLYGLDPSTLYTVEVRHRDTRGGVSAFASASFTTDAVLPTAPRMSGVALLVGRRV